MARRGEPLAKTAKGPEDKAKHEAEEERCPEGEVDAPPTASPGEIARQAAQGKLKSCKDDDEDARHDEPGGEQEEETGKTGHWFGSGGEQELSRAAKELRGVTWLRKHRKAMLDFGGALPDTVETGIGPGEYEDAAGRLLTVHALDQLETIRLRHVDVAEEEVGDEAAGAVHGLLGRIHGTSDEAILLKDESKCIGDEVLVIHYKNATHGESL